MQPRFLVHQFAGNKNLASFSYKCRVYGHN
jgi:hypothetical protein